MLRILVLTIALVFGLISCKQNTSQPPTKAPSSAAGSKNMDLPTIPQEVMKEIWDNCEMLDYLFHDLPFSMSQDEQASIRTNVTYIGPDKVESYPSNCKPMARQFYQLQGSIKYEADIYFSEGCKFYVFYEGNTKKYANQMNEHGVKFFQSMISQAMKASGQIGKQ